MSKKKLLFSILAAAVLLFSIGVMSVSASDAGAEAVAVGSADELENAIAESDSASIKLSDDITVDKEISAAADSVAIDLDGHTIATADEGTVKIADCKDLSVTNGTVKLDGEKNMFTLNSDTANISIDNVTVDFLNENAGVVTNTARNNVTFFAEAENSTAQVTASDGYTWALVNKWDTNTYIKYVLNPKSGTPTGNQYVINENLVVDKNITVVLNGQTLAHPELGNKGKFVIKKGATLVIDGTVDDSTVKSGWLWGGKASISDFFEIEEGGTLRLEGGTYFFNDIPDTCYDTNVYDKVNNNDGSITLKEKEKATVTINYAGDGLVKEGVTYNLHEGNSFTAKVDSELISGTDTYDFVNWTDNEGNEVSKDATYIFNVSKNIVLTANYKKRPTVATITLTYAGLDETVTYAAQTYTYNIGDRFDARAYSKYVTEDGTVYDFTHWTDAEGKKVSVDPIYSFNVEGSVTLTANYVKRTVATKPESSATVIIEAYNATTSDGKNEAVRVDAHYIIKGDEYTIEEVGIIYTTDETAKAEVEMITDDPTPLADKNTAVKVRSIKSDEINRKDAGQITVNLAVKTDAAKEKTIYTRAYIVVSDNTGKKKYIYTGLITTSYNTNKDGFVGSLTNTEPKIGGGN